MATYKLRDYLPQEGKVIISLSGFDFDRFEQQGGQLVQLLSASVIEKQFDADLHSWLIDFEGCRLMLRAEYYSESVWLETLTPQEGREELAFIARLLKAGI